MKGREILLVVLVVAIALSSGLIGLYLGRTSVQQAAAPSEPVVDGQAVAASTLRVFDEGQQNLLFTIENGKAYQGPVSAGQGLLTFENGKIYRGLGTTGEVLFTFSNGRLYAGGSTSGAVLYTFDNSGKVHEGDATGNVIYTFSNDRLYEGAGTNGPVVFEANRNIGQALWPVVVILADERF